MAKLIHGFVSSIVGAVIALVFLASFAPAAEAAGIRGVTGYGPRISRSGATVARTPHFPNTTTRTITQGKLHYINPAPPKSR